MLTDATSTAPLTAQTLTERCHTAFDRRTHACVGISPFNSYFSAQRVHVLAHWALTTFDRVHFFVPDTAAAYTLEALGYEPEKAAWKARGQSQYVHNKITKALVALGVERPEEHILGGEELATSTGYLDDLFHHRLALRPAPSQGYVRLATPEL